VQAQEDRGRADHNGVERRSALVADSAPIGRVEADTAEAEGTEGEPEETPLAGGNMDWGIAQA
jgi:hypothetical protein